MQNSPAMNELTRPVAIVIGVLAALVIAALVVTHMEPFGAAASGKRLERIKQSKHYRDGKFNNLAPTNKLVPGTFTEMVLHQFFGTEERVPKVPVPVVTRHASDYALRPTSGIRATWLGHASVLLEMAGRRIVTDPAFSRRCSPFDFVGPERFATLPLALTEVPAIDVVVISHDHYDHLDMQTIQALAGRGASFVVPLGIGAHLERWGVPADRIVDLDWYESSEQLGLTFTATPARHYSGRGLLDSDQTLWASWVIAAPEQRVFFSGDTGYSAEFRKIGENFGPFDLTLIKVGASDRTWQEIHMSPEEAVQTHQDVRGKLMLPIHWGTWNLGQHAWNEPAERAFAAARSAGLSLVVPKPGEWVDLAQPPKVVTWWR